MTHRSLSLFKVKEEECTFNLQPFIKNKVEQNKRENEIEPKVALEFEKDFEKKEIYWKLWNYDNETQMVFACIEIEDLKKIFKKEIAGP